MLACFFDRSVCFVFGRFGQETNTQNSEADAGSRRRLGSPDLEWFPESKQTPENAKNRDMDSQCIDPQSMLTAKTT